MSARPDNIKACWGCGHLIQTHAVECCGVINCECRVSIIDLLELRELFCKADKSKQPPSPYITYGVCTCGYVGSDIESHKHLR